MRARASKDGLTLRVIAGSNNAMLAFDLEATLRDKCLGFSIERTDLDTGERRWLPNMLRFERDALDSADIAKSAPPVLSDDKKRAPPKASKKHAPPPEQDAPMVSTARAPIQKFRWGDYTLDPGKRYRYRAVARFESADEIIAKGKEADRTRSFDGIPGGVSVEVTTENNRGHETAVFFNRGAAASRAYNVRYGNNDPSTIPDALWWLSRGLEEALLGFLGQATDKSFALHAAVYEFQKDKLLDALKLAVGRGVEVKVAYHARADKTKKANEAAIKKHKIDFAHARSAPPASAIMHNKFVVLLKKDAAGKATPVAVWTGSTNWTDGAIYGQLNVGHAVFKADIASAYETYFQLLFANAEADVMKDATVKFPLPKDRAGIAHGVTPVFSPQPKLDMIKLYAALCDGGKMVLVSAPFVLHPDIMKTFKNAPADTLRFLMADKPSALGGAAEVQLLEHGNEVSVATNLKSELHDFQGHLLEGTESFHHNGIHIHSKIIIVDPFGVDPVLVTGSANYSNNSTLHNDENSLIIRGDSGVTDVYVTEFMRMFDHYWFRAHIEGKTKGSKGKTLKQRIAGLSADASWSEPYYKAGDKKMLERQVFVGSA